MSVVQIKPTTQQVEDQRKKALKNPKTATVPLPKKPAKPAPEPKPAAELICVGEEITHETIAQFIREHAGGQPLNVRVVPCDNVLLEEERPVPFFREKTYTDKGVRYADLMDHLRGVHGNNTLSAIRAAGAKRGTSAAKNLMTWMLINGGQSRNSKTWGTSFIKLVVAK